MYCEFDMLSLDCLKLVIAGFFDRWFLVFQSFGQHGRELITTELALRILSILSEEQFLPNMNPVSLNSTLDELVIKVTFNLLQELQSVTADILIW